MAKIIKAVTHHDCLGEIRQDVSFHRASDDFYYGSVVECSCGNRFVLVASQQLGDYWSMVPSNFTGF